MSSVVDELSSICYSTAILSAESLPENKVLTNKDEHIVDHLTDQFNPSQWVYGNVRSNAPVVIFYGPQHSSLRIALIAYLTVEDITLILFSVEEHLWQWLDLNSSLTVASIILQPIIQIQKFIARSHTYVGIRSILVRCRTTDLTTIQRFSRFYRKVDGIFDDDTRLLIKLVVVSSDALKILLNDQIYDFPQVELIYVYYDNDSDFERDKNAYQIKYSKIQFIHERKVETQIVEGIMADHAISPSRPIEHETIHDVASSIEQRIIAKRSNTNSRHSPEPKRLSMITTHDYFVNNIKEIPSIYMCPFCKLIFRDPYQLNCGHHACESCINLTNNKMICSICSRVSSRENIRPDRDFLIEMQKKLISCSMCTWSGSLELYQEHIGQKHHDRESTIATTDIYTQQSDQHNCGKPVNKAETHEEIQLNVFPPSCTIFLPHNSNTINDQHYIGLGQIQEIICSLSNHLNILINNQQQIHTVNHHSHTLLQTLAHNCSSLKASCETNATLANDLKINYDLLTQEVWSIKQILDDALPTSYCGRYIWKISNVQEKIADAESERQKSIYSPPFYSSPTGYKMCLRLFLNGDSDARNTHISLFLVIMQNDYDAILHWPFSYEVLFHLIDQSTLNNNQHDITASFWPDIKSNCFRRHVNAMNHGYGIKKFLSLIEFEQNKSLYIRDNIMFIEANINFLSERPVLSSILHAGGSPNDEGHIDTINEDIMNI
ncbi:unnamed protein product, partial [Rotaria sp. Silwood1]